MLQYVLQIMSITDIAIKINIEVHYFSNKIDIPKRQTYETGNK